MYKKRRKRMVSIGEYYYGDNRGRKSRGKRIVMIDKNDYISGCWWMNSPYAKFQGKPIYQAYAAGEGSYARHLCCDKHCVNPMHLARGSAYDNKQDEVFMFEAWCEDYDYRQENDLIWIDEEEFRKRYMKKLVINSLSQIPMDKFIEEQLTLAHRLMEEFRQCKYIDIMEV